MNPMRLYVLLLPLLLLNACKGRTPQDNTTPTPTPGATQTSTSTDPPQDATKNDRPMTLHKFDLNWLVQNSPLVFVGRLSHKDVEKDARGLIISRNHFEIEQAVGEFQDKAIVLTTLGGTLGGETMNVSHMPVFTEGQRYIIFTDPKRTTYNPITENQEGVFLIGPDGGIYTYHGVAVTGFENGVLQFSDLVLEGYAPKGTQIQRSSPEPKNPETKDGVVSAQRAELNKQRPVAAEQFLGAVQRLAAQKK